MSAQDQDGRADARRELVRQAGLADARLSYHCGQDGAPAGARHPQALTQDGLLARAAYERNRSPRGTRCELLHRERIERGVEALGPDATAPGVRDVGARQDARGLTDQHLARLGGGLQPCSDVDDRAGHQQLACRRAAHSGLAGLDADPHFERTLESELVAKSPRALGDGKAGPHRAQRVVLMHVGQPENGHHRVADELLGPATQSGQFFGGGVEEAPQHLASAFGVQSLREARRVHQVREQDCDQLALLSLDQRSSRGATVGAEARRLRKGQPANRARVNHSSRICCSPWPTPS